MPQGLYAPVLDKLTPDRLVLARRPGTTLQAAMAMAASAPTNQQVLDACRGAYSQFQDAVDQATLGSVYTTQDQTGSSLVKTMNADNWSKNPPRQALASPIYQASTMAEARAAANQQQFGLFFVGVSVDVDFIIGAEGGIGIGFPLTGPPASVGLAYGGWKLSTNIDIAFNLNCGIFIEPTEEIAGDFIGIEVAAEPVEEGPEVSFGIHMKPDLSKVVGFTLGVGVALSLIPISGAIVHGTLKTVISS